MGDIAFEFGKLLRPFDCRILVYSPSSPLTRWTADAHGHKYNENENENDRVIPHERIDDLNQMVAQIDVLSIHCPLTPQTRGLIGQKELRLMKRTAVVINTARGGIVDESALAEALREGKLGGAGLDVWEIEGKGAICEGLGELGGMLNVICLPHLWVSLSLIHVRQSAVGHEDVKKRRCEGVMGQTL